MNVKNVEEESEKKKKPGSIYAPIIKLITTENKPLTIKTVSKTLSINYSIAKQRLRKMTLDGFLSRGKRGVYGLPDQITTANIQIKKIGKPVIVNGGVRKVESAKNVRLQIYCSALTKVCREKFCSIKQTGGNLFLLRKSNQFVGRKLYPLKAMATDCILSSDVFLGDFYQEIGKKNKKVEIEFYPEEWGIEIGEALGTENIKEGELGEELTKNGKIKKGVRGDSIKTDLIFQSGKKRAYIELTTVKKSKKNNRAGIKAMEIQARLYYGIKSFLTRKTPMFIVIDHEWAHEKWLSKEVGFLEKNNVELLFTDFKNGWQKTAAKKIVSKMKNNPRFVQ